VLILLFVIYFLLTFPKRILHLFEKYRVIDESLRIAQGLVSEAKSELQVFAPSPERDALRAMSDHALARDR